MKTRFLLLLCLPLALMSCKTLRPVKDSAARYVLDPTVPYRAGQSSRPALAVAKPALPTYLDRQQLVTRDGSMLNVQESNLWSEPLNTGIARVLAANLSRLTGSSSIMPVGDYVTLEYTSLVEMRIAKFDPDASGNMVLECSWKLQPVRGGDVSFRSFRTKVTVEKTIPAASGRVAAMNEALAQLAREISRRL